MPDMTNWSQLPALSADLDVIQKLDDEPNDVGGLTAAELKAKFDEAANAIKDYVNNTLLPAVQQAGEADEGALDDILNGTDIDSFGDVETALSGKQDTLTFDDVPTPSSWNPVHSGGVYSGLQAVLYHCLQRSGGDMYGAIDMGSNRIKNLPTPSADADAAPKKYVDDGLSGKLNLSGGTMSGNIAMGSRLITGLGTPSNNADAATKQYVDTGLSGKQNTLTFDNTPTANSSNPVKSGGVKTALDAKLNLSGGTMTGGIAMGSNKITGLGTPTANGDAVPKEYVDTGLSGKQNTLTFDNAPTADSQNPVKSGGVKSALDGKQDKVPIAAGAGWDALVENKAEGNSAIGDYSHAEGESTHAIGRASHAEGFGTTANGAYSHAEGNLAAANGMNSHAEGEYTRATHLDQHVFGAYNKRDSSGNNAYSRGTFVEIVGNGTSENDRSNARTLDWSGNETLAGKLTLGAGPSNSMDATTKGYVDGRNVMVSVTLAAASWVNGAQTVTVTGVLADETKQLIQPVPASASRSAYETAGVKATAQGANSLTFSCGTTPNTDLTVYVCIAGVSS